MGIQGRGISMIDGSVCEGFMGNWSLSMAGGEGIGMRVEVVPWGGEPSNLKQVVCMGWGLTKG